MDHIPVETDEGYPMKFTPEQLLPLPPVIGGRGRQIAPDLKRVIPPKIKLVDWDELERREAAGEVIKPGTAPMIGDKPTKPVKPKPYWK